jgi:hypothetical protein
MCDVEFNENITSFIVPMRHFWGGLNFRDGHLNSTAHLQVCLKCHAAKQRHTQLWFDKLQVGIMSVNMYDKDRRPLNQWSGDELVDTAKIRGSIDTVKLGDGWTIECRVEP